MDFYTGQELIKRCHEKSLPISDIMKLREITNTHLTAKGKSICGLVLSKAIAYSMAVLEVNASMGLIVAAPTAGLVESPCQSRNAIGVANALTSAELALAGITHPIPFDEMSEAMLRVGRNLPFELRETAMGGCAGTPTGCSLGCRICK